MLIEEESEQDDNGFFLFTKCRERYIYFLNLGFLLMTINDNILNIHRIFIREHKLRCSGVW